MGWIRWVGMVTLTCGGATAWAEQAGSWTLYQDPVRAWSWNTRLTASRDPGVFTGFSRRMLPVAPGWWGRHRITLGNASLAQPYAQPGDMPVPEEVWLNAQVTLDGAAGPVFLRLDPEILWAWGSEGQDSVPNPYLNDVHNYRKPQGTEPTINTAWRGSVGAVGLGHALVASSEPFQWGEGIFGGIVVGRSWKGFPHVALLPTESWDLGAPFDIPITLRYEVVWGKLVGRNPAKSPEDPEWLGFRSALRWGGTTLSTTLGTQAGGSGQALPSISEVLDDNTANTDAETNLNRVISVGLSQWCGDQVFLGVEYGIDDWWPFIGAIGDLGRLNGFHPRTAAWTVTADWVDITGSGDWRLGAEWYRSESYFYHHHLYGSYTFDGVPLAHADVGNTNSLRLLLQSQTDAGNQIDWVATWRRIGWRNIEEGNANIRFGGGQKTFTPWDTYGLDWRGRFPLENAWGDFLLNLGGALETNRFNNRFDSRWYGLMSAGWEKAW